MSTQIKLELTCECCGFETKELEIVKNFMLHCPECTAAEKRRDRFREEEEEWNRGVDQKDAN